MILKTSAFSLVFLLSMVCIQEYIEGTDSNGFDVYGYMEVDDVNAVDGFVETSDDQIIFLEDAIQNDADAFDQRIRYEDENDFFDQQYEINLEE